MPRPSRARAAPAPAALARTTVRDAIVILTLVLIVAGVYGQVRRAEFLNFDDDEYVLNNPPVERGLTIDGLRWAFATTHGGNWFPLTWISHMVDRELFGSQSGGHHLTSVVIHALTTALLFAVFRRMTGAFWPGAAVAAIFAIHPLHVESVAWVAERKDVLSGCFWVLALTAYAWYVERPTARRYAGVVLTFALGLMAKSMIVTLPVVLLLLDVWPLRRPVPWRRRLIEKVPLVSMAAAASVVTVIAQHRGGAIVDIAAIPLGARLANAAVSCVLYVRDFFWPEGLAAFYPYVTHPAWVVAGAIAIICVVTTLAIRQAPARPYLLVGWLWFLGTLAPVIGIVQVGMQSRADRYMYMPMIGLAIIVAWGAADLVRWRPRARNGVTIASVAILVALAVVARRQASYWHDTITLFARTIEVTPDNYTAENNIGSALLADGRTMEALAHLTRAVAIAPEMRHAHVNRGSALNTLGRWADAQVEFERALALAPEDAPAHSGLGVTLAKQGLTKSAMTELTAAVQLDPNYAEGHVNLGTLLADVGRHEEAIGSLRIATLLKPDSFEAHYSLGTSLVALDRFAEAEIEFRAAIRSRPDSVQAHSNLGGVLATTGRLDDAIAEFREALRLNPNQPAVQKNLERAIAMKKGEGGR